MSKKKLFILVLGLLFIITLIIILYFEKFKVNDDNVSSNESNNEVLEDNENIEDTNIQKEETNMIENNIIKLSINGNEFEMELNDSETTNKFLELLPLEITMNDLNNNEKYYYLDEATLEDMGITNSSFEYIVNYSTGEVMNKTVQKTASGKVLYMSTDFRAYE